MTRSQKAALTKFALHGRLVPRFNSIRTDVARALLDAGYVQPAVDGDLFRGGYAALKITEKGREAAVAPLAR